MAFSELTYCTNIHFGVHWADHFSELKNYAPKVKSSLQIDHLRLGLRVSKAIAQELSDPTTLSDFNKWLDYEGIRPVTFNIFPFDNFHNIPVKEQVYQPDWSQKERLDFSVNALNLASEFAVVGKVFSLSTVPVSYRPSFDENPIEAYSVMVEAARNLAHWAWKSNNLFEEKGLLITLDLEPEPDCLLEDAPTVIDFFNQYLHNFGKEVLMLHYGLSEIKAKEVLQKFIGVCFDTCHFSVRFLNLEESYNSIIEANISINKIQVSAASKAYPFQKVGLRELIEPVYLHQAFATTSTGVRRFKDLPQALDFTGDWTEMRAHFHLPLYFDGSIQIGTTQNETATFLRFLKNQPFKGVLEIETYTHSVWPQFLELGLSESITKEFEWVKNI